MTRLVLDRATLRDLHERNPVDEARTTRLQRIVLGQERSGVTKAEAEDADEVAIRDYRALHVAALDTLARCPVCPCGAVSTVCDLVAKRYLCDACAPPHALGHPQPWAPLARAVARLTTLPAGVL